MSWVKLDDQIPENEKILRAGPAAAWLYVCGLAYASRQLTDGRIPAAALPRIWDDARQAKALAARLTAEGLWEPTADGWQVHDYLEYQPSADSIRTQRDQDRRRKQGRPTGIRPDSVASAPKSSGRNPAAPSRPVPGPYPARPPESEIDTGEQIPVPPSGAPRATARAPVGPGDELPADVSVPSTPAKHEPPVRAAKPGLAPLADAFAARGLTWPRVSGAEAKAAAELLRLLGAEAVADCWADLSDPDSPYGWDAVDVRNRSFAWLLSHQRAANWSAERERRAASERTLATLHEAHGRAAAMQAVADAAGYGRPSSPVRSPTQALWDRALDDLRIQMRGEDFRSWLEGSELDVLADGSATVSVPNEHMVTWLDAKCRGLVGRVLGTLTGSPVSVNFMARAGAT